MAPFAPFFAEYLYQEIGGEKESVHLEEWPAVSSQYPVPSTQLIADMEKTRQVASLGLEARMKAKINVRQPLRSQRVQDSKLDILDPRLVELIKDEVNV